MLRVGLVVLVTGCETIFPLDGPPTVTTNCSNTESVRDDFQTLPLDGIWQTGFLRDNSVNRVDPSDHDVVLHVEAPGSGVFIESAAFFDLRGRAFEVTIASSLATDQLVELELGFPDFAVSSGGSLDAVGDAIAMRATAGGLELGLYQAGVFSPSRTVTPYDAQGPHVWRIEERDGMVIWSLDGNPEQTVPVDVGVVRPRVVAHMGTALPFDASVDDVNVGLDLSPICSATALHDAFGGPLDRQIWSDIKRQGCELVIQDNRLVPKVFDTGLDDCFLRTGLPYDLHGDGILIELAKTLAIAPSHTVYAQVEIRGTGGTDPPDFAGFVVGGDGMLTVKGSRGGTLPALPYNNQRFLRLRAEIDPTTQLDQLIWEAGSARTELTRMFQSSDYPDLGRARLTLGVYSEIGEDFGTIAFANVNPL